MNSSIKAALRRAHDPCFVQHYFAGVGLDIGVRESDLGASRSLFPRVTRVVPWHGDVAAVPGVEERAFDFVNAGQCLQNVVNPTRTLARWLDLLKPGGYLVLTVPDEDLEEEGKWPSQIDPSRRASFTVCKPASTLPASVNVLDMVRSVAAIAACERISVVRDHHVDNGGARDASGSLAERAIEVVLRKRQVPTPDEFFLVAGRAQNAQACLRECLGAVRTYPYRFDVTRRAALLLQRWNLNAEVETLWGQAVERLPEEWEPKLYQFLHLISAGKIHEGFQLRAERVRPWPWQRRTTAKPPADIPEWTGQPLQGKSIVIWSEFGLGDEIFFLRFAQMLRDQAGAATVTVVCQKLLVGLFEASGEADAVVAVDQTATLPVHDFWVYPHDIPAFLPVELDALPDSVPYLRIPQGMPAFELAGRAGALKVGIAFKGAPTHENDRYRSLPSLSVLDPLFAHRDVEFYSLQKGAGADEAAAYAKRLENFHDVGVATHTMMDTARAIAAMDLVLTVDTSVAHVAGALGKPTWLLLPGYGDWRWHLVREDSPWYPTMRLFRNQAAGGWSEVVTRVNGHLLGLVAARAESADESSTESSTETLGEPSRVLSDQE
ncbi:methyltransferase domain-containing protein [Cupriavidus sp. D384]|uniref:methyltransferase domain-containing protein n=1 Tax=Cupriavidus sp. D384 TaxID=1538095 RepID=UPI000834643D|nr:methyltransferase domain-containing protein [Cupriavidus sp. D384]